MKKLNKLVLMFLKDVGKETTFSNVIGIGTVTTIVQMLFGIFDPYNIVGFCIGMILIHYLGKCAEHQLKKNKRSFISSFEPK